MSQKNIINRLKRIEGQVRGLQKMVEEDRQCSEVLTQLSAITGALEKTAEQIVKQYTKGCILEYEKTQNEKILDDLIANISKLKNI
ncbi:metal-sensitive transcriptional regulator [Oceanotoga sp. DSM 15011]|jgi:DNA-binding FrmR family transcriptional regulator|uniref:DNA-binding FrmR family transcriptional regulator n=1 Tax=Oceanotoga teriensis TaxID=515440 RepID=A0AA45C4Z4_9BACT|nr:MULTISPECIES: metal-sensitive transcriptional regulator [Oceanotoga]MDN5341340.1 CsoR family transcriptional regulator, copper-sensing transcriptional repressor [Oceanotoga sp.]MDO7976934.1 metal-sensitive transcriptional regulator [Oceanotoga teriensis]PWJ87401.1 DNA-binding FrmR family transcriptional regulator [Oceanotoga teriensis]UYO99595.1 metal-sensitive transcriptional regulator [Oceanotoga sp. DSM 15011]